MTQTDAELGPGRQLAIEIFIVLAIGFVLGLIGPFGSYAMPLAWRLAYWMGFGLIGYALFRPLNAVAEMAARISGKSNRSRSRSWDLPGVRFSWP